MSNPYAVEGATTERRAYPRKPLHLAVHVETASDDHALECETVDLSLGGTRLRAPERLPIGRVVLVFVQQRHDEIPLVLRGEVLDEWVDLSSGFVEARIHFLDLRDSAVERLAYVLETIDLRD